MVVVRELQPEEWVTQAGDSYSKGGHRFRHSNRPSEPDVSLAIGALSPREVCDLRGQAERNRKTTRDSARRARVGRLRDLGFRVEHTPRPWNPKHVSAYWDDGSWTDGVAEKFCSAFHAPRPPQNGDPDD